MNDLILLSRGRYYWFYEQAIESYVQYVFVYVLFDTEILRNFANFRYLIWSDYKSLLRLKYQLVELIMLFVVLIIKIYRSQMYVNSTILSHNFIVFFKSYSPNTLK